MLTSIGAHLIRPKPRTQRLRHLIDRILAVAEGSSDDLNLLATTATGDDRCLSAPSLYSP